MAGRTGGCTALAQETLSEKREEQRAIQSSDQGTLGLAGHLLLPQCKSNATMHDSSTLCAVPSCTFEGAAFFNNLGSDSRTAVHCAHVLGAADFGLHWDRAAQCPSLSLGSEVHFVVFFPISHQTDV